MKRNIEENLESWAQAKERKPLILRGARQTGKSYLINNFLAKKFNELVLVNFEELPEFKDCFSGSLTAELVLSQIKVITKSKLVPGESLLFLDEIQECPRAITALRYFKEQMPELHVVSAGSLLEFALGEVSMPVGRVTNLYLGALCFEEFLDAIDENLLLEFINNSDFKKPFPTAIHNKAIELVKLYMSIGAMPEVVREYSKTKELLQAQQKQEDLISLYKSDFPKYAKNKSQFENIGNILKAIPKAVSNQITYNKLIEGVRSSYIKDCLNLLEKARILSPSYPTSGLPLGANFKTYPIKLYLVDIGLMQRISSLSLERWIHSSDKLVNSGALAEQFIAQNIVAKQNIFDNKLHYWKRDKVGSQAEVDFLLETSIGHYAIEVKAGKTGRLKSLNNYLEINKDAQGIKFSTENISNKNRIKSLPLYCISTWLKRINCR